MSGGSGGNLDIKIMRYLAEYMDVKKYSGKVILIHGDEVKFYSSLNDARQEALRSRGISIIIQVPSEGEVDFDFRRFMKYIGSKY